MVSGEEQPESQEQEQPGPPPGNYPPSDSDESQRSNPALDFTSLAQNVRARKAEYTRQRSIRIKVGTWNVASIAGTEKDIGKWFVKGEGVCRKLSGLQVTEDQKQSRKSDGESGESQPMGNHSEETKKADDSKHEEFDNEEVGLYVLGLQEIVDLSSPAETLSPFADSAPSSKWKSAVQSALPEGYVLTAETQLVGLLLLIYAAPSVAPFISSVSSASVGTGLLGYMGNKGAVATRLMLGETTCLVFVNCHLAAGSDKNSLERRNWDALQIITRTKFDRVNPEKSLRDNLCQSIGLEDFGFWFGDLNYRLEDIPGDDVRNVLARHTANEYDQTCEPVHQSDQQDPSKSPQAVAQKDQKRKKPSDGEGSDSPPSPVSDDDIEPHADPASLQTTISSLIPHDQLRMQQKQGKAFHEGWREGEISFLPTYKYDVGSVAMFDSSEKHRGPSWCDRILYRTRQDKLNYEQRVKDSEAAKKRDEEMKARGLDKADADDKVLFEYDPSKDGADSASDYDPSADGASENAPAPAEAQAQADDSLRLEYYASHQGILSSDHKPIDAGFTLTFECVIPELKAKVHQEVVRELDKAENEARPGLTVVVDLQPGDGPSTEERDPNAIDFGDVPFDFPISRTLTVANTSGVPATFTFAEKPSLEEKAKSTTPPWLQIKVDRPADAEEKHESHRLPSEEHTLLPGELANVEVTARVRDIFHVRLLNAGRLKLEEILVLRVTNGRDHFIPAHANWLPTCFGRSLDELTHMPEAGARSLAAAAPSAQKKDDAGARLNAPRELFRLTEAISELTERAVAEWGMTQGADDEESPPWAAEPHGTVWPFKPETWTLKDPEVRAPLLASVREALDTNRPPDSIFSPEVSSLHRLEILSETLIAFLRSLSDGIVTASVWEKMEKQIISREKEKKPPRSWDESQAWVLENLAYSPAHSVSFTFVTFMLAHIANEIAPATPIPPRPTDRPPTQGQQTYPSPASTAAFISGGSFRRRARSQTSSSNSEVNANPVMQRRQAVELAFASVFSNILISADVAVPTKEKDKRIWDERKRSIIEPFLKSAGVDNRGPSGGVS